MKGFSRSNRSLKIGYIMQADSVEMTQVSGPQLHVKAVVQGLKQRGHRVRTVAIQQDRSVTSWSDDLVRWQPATFGLSQARWFRFPERGLRRVQSSLNLPFLRLFDSVRFSDACVAALPGYDVLYERFGLMSYGGLIAAKRVGTPMVIEMNGDLIEEFKLANLGLSRAQWVAIHIISAIMMRYVDHVVVVSEALKQTIITQWRTNPLKVSIVPNGADLQLFSNAAGSDEVRTRYLPSGGKSIVFVSGFQPWHGIDLLLDAFARVAASDWNVTLILVGDGPTTAQIQAKALALGLNDRVVFTGVIPHEEVAAVLKISDVAVANPRASKMTQSQSFLKLFEYMAAGTAIVAPEVPHIQQVINHGVNGFLVHPDDAAALASALAELLSNDRLRRELGSAAKQQAMKGHSWDHTVAELESIMFKLKSKSG